MEKIDPENIAKQIFEKNNKRTPKFDFGILKPAEEEGEYFDFNVFAKMTCTEKSRQKYSIIVSLSQILNSETKLTTGSGKNKKTVEAEYIYLLPGEDESGNRKELKPIKIEKGKINLKLLLEKMLTTLDIEDIPVNNLKENQIKEIFEKLQTKVEKQNELDKEEVSKIYAEETGDSKLNTINTLIFKKTIDFLLKPENRSKLEASAEDISNLNEDGEEIVEKVNKYLKDLKNLKLSGNKFDEIEQIFAYYRENGADNLEVMQMLDFYGAFYNAVKGEEKSADTFKLKHENETFEFNGGNGNNEYALLKYKIIEREGKKFIVLDSNFLKDFLTLIEMNDKFSDFEKTPQGYLKFIYGKIKEEDKKDATLVVPSLTNLTGGGHYVAYLCSGFDKTKKLDSLDDKRQESAKEKKRHFGVGGGFCGLHAVEAVMALTTGVKLIGKNDKDGKTFSIDKNGETKELNLKEKAEKDRLRKEEELRRQAEEEARKKAEEEEREDEENSENDEEDEGDDTKDSDDSGDNTTSGSDDTGGFSGNGSTDQKNNKKAKIDTNKEQYEPISSQQGKTSTSPNKELPENDEKIELERKLKEQSVQQRLDKEKENLNNVNSAKKINMKIFLHILEDKIKIDKKNHATENIETENEKVLNNLNKNSIIKTFLELNNINIENKEIILEAIKKQEIIEAISKFENEEDKDNKVEYLKTIIADDEGRKFLEKKTNMVLNQINEENNNNSKEYKINFDFNNKEMQTVIKGCPNENSHICIKGAFDPKVLVSLNKINNHNINEKMKQFEDNGVTIEVINNNTKKVLYSNNSNSKVVQLISQREQKNQANKSERTRL